MDKWIYHRMASGCYKLRMVKQSHRSNVRDTLSQQMLPCHWPKRFTSFFKLYVSNISVSAAGNFVHLAFKYSASSWLSCKPQTAFTLHSSFGDCDVPTRAGPIPDGPTRMHEDCYFWSWWQGVEHGIPGHWPGSCFLPSGLQWGANTVGPTGPSELQICINDHCLFSLIFLIQ